jgi:hypothetical protein
VSGIRPGTAGGGPTAGAVPGAGTVPLVSEPDRPEFGPSGYLPPRAAQRARKIVLRAPLGLQWVVGSLVVGVVVVGAGLLWLMGDDVPDEPWVAVGAVADVGTTAEPDGLDVLLVGNGRIRAFADAVERGAAYCPDSRRLESAGGEVWSLTGRGLGGTPSLHEHPTRVHDGILYVDPTHTMETPAPSPEAVEPACH